MKQGTLVEDLRYGVFSFGYIMTISTINSIIIATTIDEVVLKMLSDQIPPSIPNNSDLMNVSTSILNLTRQAGGSVTTMNLESNSVVSNIGSKRSREGFDREGDIIIGGNHLVNAQDDNFEDEFPEGLFNDDESHTNILETLQV
ncbi:unnamed protein product [Cunninghamella blakesleeana]